MDRHVSERRYPEIVTRFPPEPNGFLHIGHVKSIVLNFGISAEYRGRCHLRFDDTNPETENEAFVRAIQEDVRWLGYDWGGDLFFAADYFERMYGVAEDLIRKGLAYVDSSTEDEIREARGSVIEPGRPTAFRDRTVEENLDLFRRMRAAEFSDGAHVLRAKVDLSSPNMIMRDPGALPDSVMRTTTEPETTGASTPSTTTRTAWRTRSRGLPIRSAPWSSRTIEKSTTGSSMKRALPSRAPISTSSRA